MSSRRNPPNRLATPLHPRLASLAPYPPGKPIEEVQREFGLKHVVKLASNENPLGPSPKAIKAMTRSAREMNLYPDGGGYALRHELAARLGVRPEELILGEGSDEVTTLLALAYLGPGRSIVTSQYAFSRYQMAAQLVGADAALVPMKNFRHDPRALFRAVDRTTRIVFIDNPGNPTGSMMTRSELASILRTIPRDVFVMVDEAYYDFACANPDYPQTLALRASNPNLILTRTFSKAYGLAGLRIGYGIARPEVIEDLERVRAPFNTSRIAQAAALAALSDNAHLRRTVTNNARGLNTLGRAMEKLGLRVVPSSANFLLVDLSPRGRLGGEVYQSLLRRGVIVRPMAGYGLPNHVRISIGTPAENRMLIQALTSVLKSPPTAPSKG